MICVTCQGNLFKPQKQHICKTCDGTGLMVVCSYCGLNFSKSSGLCNNCEGTAYGKSKLFLPIMEKLSGGKEIPISERVDKPSEDEFEFGAGI